MTTTTVSSLALAMTRDDLTASECDKLLVQAQAALQQSIEAAAPSHPGDSQNHRGARYAAAALSGDPAQLRAVEEDQRDAQAEVTMVREFIAELHRRRSRARVHEAHTGLPKLHAALIAALDKIDATHKQLMADCDSLNSTYDAIAKARMQLTSAGLPGSEGATPLTLRRLCRLHLVAPGRYRPDQYGNHVDTIGVEHMAEEDAA